ncbi:AraC family transcriptional regulator [Paenibacillus peoriae]|uniref:AraC family transcriptional regulator n=1 Tax=Paenibacillus peoriae TaxID=59893 RepID=UPI00026C66EE|nr:AraC family transcriptional regulator [Paenibacillus peoriae]MEC0182422.1 AraC family transcriptional regulator [Paenibacillus peoriae]
MKSTLKENSIHGTPSFPLHIYSKLRKTDYYVGYHWHEELEFIYVEEGTMEVTVNSEILHISNGDFVFINSGDLHQVTSNGPSIHHAIVFQPQLLNFEYPDICQQTIIKPITTRALQFPCTMHLDKELKEELAEKLRNIISIKKGEDKLSALRIKVVLLQIIDLLFERELFLENQLQTKEKQERIKKVILYIEEHYNEKISLEDLASIVGMNKNYFSTYFQIAVGKNPVTYINEYRCEKAAKLLKNRELKVLEISLMVGFENFSYFIRKFKEYKRYSPSQYRKMVYD